MIKKCFIGVDYQLDFMEGGSLPVNGGKACAEKCAEFLKTNDFKVKIFTCDWHPWNHSSFKEFGGEWPSHCVEHSLGASISDNILTAANSTKGITKILTKGSDCNSEEYSIFRNPMANLYLRQIFQIGNFDEFHFGGIAGNVCLLNTLKDVIQIIDKTKIIVHLDLTASLDENHKTLVEWCNINNIKVV